MLESKKERVNESVFLVVQMHQMSASETVKQSTEKSLGRSYECKNRITNVQIKKDFNYA